MPYSKLQIPRFYCNVMEFLSSNGPVTGSTASGVSFTGIPEYFKTLPVNVTPYYANADMPEFDIYGLTSQSYIAVLGHEMGTGSYNYSVEDHNNYKKTQTNIYNAELDQDEFHVTPTHDGYSISTFNGSGIEKINVITNENQPIGSIVIGTYWEAPHSVEIVSIKHDMDGIKKTRTRGGVDLINNQNYLKPKKWGNLGSWELLQPDANIPQSLSRVGRRSWSMTLKYLSDTYTVDEPGGQIFPEVSNLNTLEAVNPDGTPYSDISLSSYYTLNSLNSYKSFYSQVVHRINNRPFIFQPDKNEPIFAICKIDMNSFQFDHVFNRINDVKIKIREVW